jgi:DNA polymerase-3 subunit epsilon
LRNLELDRPLVCFDLETTGTDPATDRIVEISCLRVAPAGDREARTRRINPEQPIPPEATAVHGITDDDVRDAPTFRQVAKALLDWLGDADLAGFNAARFDVPLLEQEFRRCGLELNLARRRVIDAMVIFKRKEPRDLTAAVRFYLDRDHEGAHSAEADVTATLEILEAQVERYEDLPNTVGELARWTRAARPGAVDPDGKFVWRNGEAVFAFGKHQGKSLRTVAQSAPDYLRWITSSDFPPEAKELVTAALAGRFPESDA